MVECCIILAIANCILAVVSINILGKEYRIHAFIDDCLNTLHIEEVNHILTMVSLYKDNGNMKESDKLLNTAEWLRKQFNITTDKLRSL